MRMPTIQWGGALGFAVALAGGCGGRTETDAGATGGSGGVIGTGGTAGYAGADAGAFVAASAQSCAGAGNGKWGHADLSGNVDEWALDWYGTYPTVAGTNYADTSNTLATPRVIRGGSFYSLAYYLRAACRVGWYPYNVSTAFGVRCARAVQ
jgi:formylglycine-generating enzyme required for sulfatase activity